MYTPEKKTHTHTVCASVLTLVHRERKKYDPGSREMAGWMLNTGSATDLNSSVPTHVEARRGVKTMWFLGETHTTSYKLVSIPFISLQPAHPVPSTTTLGLSFPFSVGSSEAKPDVVKKRVCLVGERLNRDWKRWRRTDIFGSKRGRTESREKRFRTRGEEGMGVKDMMTRGARILRCWDMQML
jgi:hypothetical protein